MVRFSDIIKVGDNSQDKDESREGRIGGEDVLRMETPGFEAKEEAPFVETLEQEVPGPGVSRYFETFLKRAADIRERVRKDQGISPSPILADLHQIINQDLVDGMYEHAMSHPDQRGGFVAHSVDVTFACLRIGRGLDYELERLLKLGLAAFLENVGMYKIPEGILSKEGRLEDTETAIIRKHPKAGSEILSRMGIRYEWLAEVALQVHERWDGSGYPHGLKGPEISEMASIIGLVDTYMAMIKKRPYRDRILPPDAIKSIIKEAKGLFPPRILKIFLNQMSLFPVNTCVKLNNKSVGRVVSTDENQPLRPTVKILYDGLGNRLGRHETVRLAENPLLYITESLDDRDLP